MNGNLSKADARLAQRASGLEPSPRRHERKYRCDSCGLLYPAEELTPDFDEEGKRVGWTCDNCY